MPFDREQFQKAALAIERQIDQELETLATPLPDRTWLVGLDMSCMEGVEIVYKCADGTELNAEFGPDELRQFLTNPKSSTMEKISALALRISRARAAKG